jgi:hypothetical protein
MLLRAGYFWLRIGMRDACCEHSDEFSDSVKCKEYIM